MDTQKKDEKALVVLTQGQLKDIYEKAAADSGIQNCFCVTIIC